MGYKDQKPYMFPIYKYEVAKDNELSEGKYVIYYSTLEFNKIIKNHLIDELNYESFALDDFKKMFEFENDKVSNKYLVSTKFLINETKLSSVDAESFDEGTHTYEELFNIPVLYQILGEYNYIKNKFTESQDYKLLRRLQEIPNENEVTFNDFKELSDETEIKKKYEQMITTEALNAAQEQCFDYLLSKFYMDIENYSREDYIVYNIPTEKLTDKVMILTGEDNEIKAEHSSIYNLPINGILISRKTMNKEVPMLYYQLPHTYYVDNGYLKIKWNVDGIFSLE